MNHEDGDKGSTAPERSTPDPSATPDSVEPENAADEPASEADEAPTTQPSADEAPTTQPSADEAPTTQPSADEAPTTQPSADEAPTTQLDLGDLGERSEEQAPLWVEPPANEDVTQVIPAIPPGPVPGPTQAYTTTAAEDPTVVAPAAAAPVPPQPEPEPSAPAEPSTESTTPAPWVKIAAVTGGVIALIGIAYAADLAVSSGNVPRGVTVAGVDVGGSTREEAEATLQAQVGPRVGQPLTVQAGDVSTELVPSAAGLGVDWEATLDRAHSQPLNPFTRVASFFTTDEIGVVSTRDEAALASAVDGLRSETDRASREGTVVFEGATPVPVDPSTGQNLNGEGAEAALIEKWAFGRTVDLPVDVVPVSVTQEGVQRALNDVAVPAASADLVVTGREGKVATAPRQQIGAIVGFEPDGNGGLKPTYNVEAATGILAPQLVSTEIVPKDAKITLDGGSPTVVPAVVGDLVQWPKTLETLPEVLRGNGSHTTAAVYGPIPPALTTEAAQALGVKEVVGEFTTGGFSAASGTNIRLAASEINGALIKPGDTFSLNGYTGPRGTAQGYVESGIINNGRPDTAVGGGVSQVATTLYNAAYFAGMEDVAHTEHSYYISRYPEAREATVFEGAIDLQFRNTGKTGVMIQAIGGASDLTIRFWGTKSVDVESITGNRTKPTQPDTVTLPAGDHCIASSGAPGFTASDTRVISDHATGQEISRDTRTVRYDPVPIVKCEEPGAPKPDERTPAAAPAPSAPAESPTATPKPKPNDGE
ncbi:VanW family protein [Rhodococcus koreensis]|uniref:Vancomycin resistance protein YoaR, contains peptidoglycan-binding and VanW domains n=2 Tax=Rhodococcus koreensis TaxID=99653 RepID=A0A1H4RSQ3_9NOCA|nr:VanW family protein [Rhodococcus koreensis]SEC34933.1 Vancomycin resistance protein YoaR, contains peptidoglycan-binding and VanW domains [Rhodococcus koreensis]